MRALEQPFWEKQVKGCGTLQRGGGNPEPPQVPLSPRSGGSLLSARSVVNLIICDHGYSFREACVVEFQLWGMDFAIVI